jgi:hypothetical protein
MRFEGVPRLAAKSAFFGLNLAILVLALVGLWQLRCDERARLIAAPILYLAVVLVPFHAEIRYTLPALVPLIWFAGSVLFTVGRPARSYRQAGP